jgi:hypothetical protein
VVAKDRSTGRGTRAAALRLTDRRKNIFFGEKFFAVRRLRRDGADQGPARAEATALQSRSFSRGNEVTQMPFDSPAVMNDDRLFSNRHDAGLAATLESAVPAQEGAKSALRTEFSVFMAQLGVDSLEAQPVLLRGNAPGRVPGALVQGLAAEARLPWVEVSASQGVSLDEVVSRLARQHVDCPDAGPLGIALLSDLEHLTPLGARGLAAHLAAGGHSTHGHQGRVLKLSQRQVFWVGCLRVTEPSRRAAKPEADESGTTFALLTVGPSAGDVVAGVAGPVKTAGPDEVQAEVVEALAQTFRADAWLLPGTPDDLVEWAGAENEPWWPGRRVREYCEHHGVAFQMGAGAVEAWAAWAARHGGTVDGMEGRLRRAMDPVLAAVADRSQPVTTVEMTPAALALIEAPQLHPGPRRPAAQSAAAAAEGPVRIERPPRTPQSSPDVRLARAADLEPILSIDHQPVVP